jgi:hypothetical protein
VFSSSVTALSSIISTWTFPPRASALSRQTCQAYTLAGNSLTVQRSLANRAGA